MNLWPEKDLETHTNTIDHPKQRSLWTVQQSLDQKFKMLHIDVSGSIQTMIGLGKLNADGLKFRKEINFIYNISGSFKYLDEEKVNN